MATHYNLYEGTGRLNRKPLTEKEVEKIFKSNIKSIKKMVDGNLKEIPLNRVRIVKCTII